MTVLERGSSLGLVAGLAWVLAAAAGPLPELDRLLSNGDGVGALAALKRLGTPRPLADLYRAEALLVLGDPEAAWAALEGARSEPLEDFYQRLGERAVSALLPPAGSPERVRRAPVLAAEARARGLSGPWLELLECGNEADAGRFDRAATRLLELGRSPVGVPGPAQAEFVRSLVRVGRALADSDPERALDLLELAGERASLEAGDGELLAKLAARRRGVRELALDGIRRARAEGRHEEANRLIRLARTQFREDPVFLAALDGERRADPVAPAVPTASPATPTSIREGVAEWRGPLEAARTAFAAGRLEEAEARLGEAVRRAAPEAEAGPLGELLAERRRLLAWREEGRAAFREGRYQEARTKLEAARDGGVEVPDLEFARCLLESGDLRRSRILFREIDHRSPLTAEDRLRLARAEDGSVAPRRERSLRAAAERLAAGELRAALESLAVSWSPELGTLATALAGIFTGLAVLAFGAGRQVGRGSLAARERELTLAAEAQDAERRKAQERGERAAEKAVALSHLSARIVDLAGAVDQAGLVTALTQGLTRSVGSSRFTVWRVETGAGRLVPVNGPGLAEGPALPLSRENPYGYAWLEKRMLDRTEVLRDPSLSGLRAPGPVPLGLALPVVPGDGSGLVVNLQDIDPDRIETSDRTSLRALRMVAELALQNIRIMEASERERTQLVAEVRDTRALMGRLVSPRIADRLIELEKAGGRSFDSRKMNLTVLFSDIRGFTTLSEKLPPEDLVKALNEYLAEMTAILFEYNGTLDKYWGDAIMAYFGAPLEFPDHALWALRAAQAMQRRLRELEARWRSQGRVVFQAGIGLNTGPMVWGAIGSQAQLSYTVIGDEVNVAARLQSAAGPGRIFMSRATWEACGRPPSARPIDRLQVKGRVEPVEVLEVDPATPL